MCGIAGIVRYDQPGAGSEIPLRAMLRALRHRGPDDQGIATFASAVLGNARLSFLDRARGKQPMTETKGRWSITYNGEIYNHAALRAELEGGWRFLTDCDTEVVLAAYVRWGEAALARLNGMFGFFIWDNATETGFAARDRLGVKPLAYRHHSGVFAFASEAKALLPCLPGRPRPNLDGVLEYLVAPYFSGVETSMFEGIEYLAPGHCLRIDREGLTVRRWWEWTRPDLFDPDSGALAEDLTARISAAVRDSLHGEHPCATFLSGGLDSTLITALAARQLESPPTAYTIQFAGQDGFDYRRSRIVRSDDTPHACAAARELGLSHHVVKVARDRLPFDLLEVAAINDALPAWEQEIAQHHLSRAAGARHRAVLVGDAADETHYGYPFLLDRGAGSTPRQIIERFGRAPISRAWTGDATGLFDEKYRALAESAGYRWDTAIDRLHATTYLIVKRWLPRLLHNGDIHTMAFSLEARVPFTDCHVLALARRVDPLLALTNGEEKGMLRKAARGLMPETNRTRRKSALPKDQGTGEIYQREATAALAASGDFLKVWLELEPLRHLAAAPRALSENERSLLFRVIALHHWRRAYEVQAP
jgi:asparagine synthase (glutamine-hydrolysing)